MIEAMEDKPEHAAAGEAAAIMAAGAAAGLRPDLTVIPLEGVESSHAVLATRAGDRSRPVTALAACAGELLTGPGAEGEAGSARGVAPAPVPGGEPGSAAAAVATPLVGVVPVLVPGVGPGSVRGAAPAPVRGVAPGSA